MMWILWDNPFCGPQLRPGCEGTIGYGLMVVNYRPLRSDGCADAPVTDAEKALASHCSRENSVFRLLEIKEALKTIVQDSA